MMTRKHYKRIAEILKNHDPKKPFSYLTWELMTYFKEDNPAFDRMKFIRAAEFKGYEEHLESVKTK